MLLALPRRSENFENLIWFKFSPDLRKIIDLASVRRASLINRKLIEQVQRKRRLGFDPKSIFFQGESEEIEKSQKFWYSILSLEHFQLKKKIDWAIWRIKKAWFDSKIEFVKEGKKIRRIWNIFIRNWKKPRHSKWQMNNTILGQWLRGTLFIFWIVQNAFTG